jgi:hypothetical protein
MFELLLDVMDRASGTFAGSSRTTICALHRPNLISDRILHLRDGDSSGMRSKSSCRVTIVTPRRSFDFREISQQALASRLHDLNLSDLCVLLCRPLFHPVVRDFAQRLPTLPVLTSRTLSYPLTSYHWRDFRVHSLNRLANLLTECHPDFFRHYDCVRLCFRSPFGLGGG